jgi:hypothetical protein
VRGEHYFRYLSLVGGYSRFPNGDGFLNYPGAPINQNGWLPGIRLEAVREGAEDYEYYRILFNLVAKSDGRND